MNEALIENLWHEHHAELSSYVRRRVSHEDTAEDIVQLVFVKAWIAMCKGIGFNEHARGWLYRIARNLVIDHYRDQGRMPECVELDAFEEENEEDMPGRAKAEIVAAKDAGPHELAEYAILEAEVNRGILQLTDAQATVVTMYLDGYTFGDIAESIDVTLGGTKALMHRARVNLREWLRV